MAGPADSPVRSDICSDEVINEQNRANSIIDKLMMRSESKERKSGRRSKCTTRYKSEHGFRDSSEASTIGESRRRRSRSLSEVTVEPVHGKSRGSKSRTRREESPTERRMVEVSKELEEEAQKRSRSTTAKSLAPGETRDISQDRNRGRKTESKIHGASVSFENTPRMRSPDREEGRSRRSVTVALVNEATCKSVSQGRDPRKKGGRSTRQSANKDARKSSQRGETQSQVNNEETGVIVCKDGVTSSQRNRSRSRVGKKETRLTIGGGKEEGIGKFDPGREPGKATLASEIIRTYSQGSVGRLDATAPKEKSGSTEMLKRRLKDMDRHLNLVPVKLQNKTSERTIAGALLKAKRAALRKPWQPDLSSRMDVGGANKSTAVESFKMKLQAALRDSVDSIQRLGNRDMQCREAPKNRGTCMQNQMAPEGGGSSMQDLGILESTGACAQNREAGGTSARNQEASERQNREALKSFVTSMQNRVAAGKSRRSTIEPRNFPIMPDVDDMDPITSEIEALKSKLKLTIQSSEDAITRLVIDRAALLTDKNRSRCRTAQPAKSTEQPSILSTKRSSSDPSMLKSNSKSNGSNNATRDNQMLDTVPKTPLNNAESSQILTQISNATPSADALSNGQTSDSALGPLRSRTAAGRSRSKSMNPDPSIFRIYSLVDAVLSKPKPELDCIFDYSRKNSRGRDNKPNGKASKEAEEIAPDKGDKTTTRTISTKPSSSDTEPRLNLSNAEPGASRPHAMPRRSRSDDKLHPCRSASSNPPEGPAIEVTDTDEDREKQRMNKAKRCASVAREKGGASSPKRKRTSSDSSSRQPRSKTKTNAKTSTDEETKIRRDKPKGRVFSSAVKKNKPVARTKAVPTTARTTKPSGRNFLGMKSKKTKDASTDSSVDSIWDFTPKRSVANMSGGRRSNAQLKLDSSRASMRREAKTVAHTSDSDTSDEKYRVAAGRSKSRATISTVSSKSDSGTSASLRSTSVKSGDSFKSTPSDDSTRRTNSKSSVRQRSTSSRETITETSDASYERGADSTSALSEDSSMKGGNFFSDDQMIESQTCVCSKPFTVEKCSQTELTGSQMEVKKPFSTCRSRDALMASTDRKLTPSRSSCLAVDNVVSETSNKLLDSAICLATLISQMKRMNRCEKACCMPSKCKPSSSSRCKARYPRKCSLKCPSKNSSKCSRDSSSKCPPTCLSKCATRKKCATAPVRESKLQAQCRKASALRYEPNHQSAFSMMDEADCGTAKAPMACPVNVQPRRTTSLFMRDPACAPHECIPISEYQLPPCQLPPRQFPPCQLPPRQLQPCQIPPCHPPPGQRTWLPPNQVTFEQQHGTFTSQEDSFPLDETSSSGS
nr:PREDICTED: muscle M-line assembly protein unc-89-like isoform X2 [Bemisia tabaci]